MVKSRLLKNQNEGKKRKRERFYIVLISLVILALTWVEIYLFKVSTKLPFENSLFFFGLMNFNLILFMILLFLVFRNAIKLILDAKKGRIGSRLRARLVFSFILFAIIPTVLLFTVSAFYIKSSFDKWFSLRVGETLNRSIEIVNHYYENTKKNGAHFAKKIAISLSQTRSSEFPSKLRQLQSDYGLDGVEYYSSVIAKPQTSFKKDLSAFIPRAPVETLRKTFKGFNECRIQTLGTGELVRCGQYINANLGVVYADFFIPLSVSAQLSDISITYKDFLENNPVNYPIKSTYFTILSMMTLLLLFAATWTGFYIAKRLTIPVEELIKGTEAIAQGNLSYQIPKVGTDEFSKLILSFNQMTSDLKANKEILENNNRELNQRKHYIEVLLESVQSAVISLDRDGLVTVANSAAGTLLRRSINSIIGNHYSEFLPERNRQEFKILLRDLYENLLPVRKEIKILSDRKTWLTLLITLSVLQDENKKSHGVVVVIEDVTEIQRMERLSAWQEIAKRMAHEIKNPLTPIQLSVERLRRRYLDKLQDDGAFNESTRIILSEVDSLKTLVNEFSSFARMPELKLRPYNLNEVIQEAVTLFKTAHESIHFELDLDSDLPFIHMDPPSMKRVLINLFDNAVTAMNNVGAIEVRSRWSKEKGRVTLWVNDEGCGLSETTSQHLFEPYFSTKVGGTGLGLAIVQKIIHDHGALVRVSGNHPRGTSFEIEFLNLYQAKDT